MLEFFQQEVVGIIMYSSNNVAHASSAQVLIVALPS